MISFRKMCQVILTMSKFVEDFYWIFERKSQRLNEQITTPSKQRSVSDGARQILRKRMCLQI